MVSLYSICSVLYLEPADASPHLLLPAADILLADGGVDRQSGVVANVHVTSLTHLFSALSRHTLHVNDVAATLMTPRIAGSIGEASNTCTVPNLRHLASYRLTNQDAISLPFT